MSRAKQALAYAEKWERRGTLPEALAPFPEVADLLPCLPRPAALHRPDGSALDRFGVRGPGAELMELPRPCLAVLGEGSLELKAGSVRRSTPLGAWEGLELPALRPGGVLLLPAPKLKALQELLPGAEVAVGGAFDTLVLRAGPEGIHPTVH
jgi:hypothetical protein